MLSPLRSNTLTSEPDLNPVYRHLNPPFLMFRFLTSTAVRGLFIILPVALIIMLLGEMVDMTIAFAAPIADFLDIDPGENPLFSGIIAFLLIALVSLLVGLLTLIKLSRTAGGWVERRLLHPIPGYLAIKRLLNALAGNDQVESFQPMLLSSGEDEEEIVFLIEELGNDRAAVLIPFAPTPMAGNVRFVPMARLKPLDAGLGQVFDVLAQWGVGSSKLLGS